MVRIGISGVIGYETAEKLMKDHARQLKRRFPDRFLKTFDELSECLVHINADDHVAGPGIYAFEISDTGVFGTLWTALEEMSGHIKPPLGCDVDLREIPLSQQIIEICELVDENPYEVSSAGSYVVIWDEDEAGVEPETGCPVIPIGYVTHKKERLIYNGDMIRYLTPCKRQKKDIEARIKDLKNKDADFRKKGRQDGNKG